MKHSHLELDVNHSRFAYLGLNPARPSPTYHGIPQQCLTSEGPPPPPRQLEGPLPIRNSPSSDSAGRPSLFPWRVVVHSVPAFEHGKHGIRLSQRALVVKHASQAAMDRASSIELDRPWKRTCRKRTSLHHATVSQPSEHKRVRWRESDFRPKA